MRLSLRDLFSILTFVLQIEFLGNGPIGSVQLQHSLLLEAPT